MAFGCVGCGVGVYVDVVLVLMWSLNVFYCGNVYTLYKDTVFEPSSAIRHATEFFATLSEHYFNPTEIPPIMCLYTDGGPDHRTTYGSVQVSLLCLFIRGNFDMLIAMRIAPAQS